MFSTKKESDIYLNKLFANVDKKKVKYSPEKLLTFKEGDIVFKKGDKSKFIYLIMEGEVKIKMPNPPFAPKILFKYKNDFFGEKELLEKKERSSSCVAEKACQLYPISANELQKLISENKQVKDNLEMVTIATEGKTLKEITKETVGKKETEEKTDSDEAIKIHPKKPISHNLSNETEEEITIDNIFKTEKEPKLKGIFEERQTDRDIPEIKNEFLIDEIKKEEKIETGKEKIVNEKYPQITDAGNLLFKTTNVDELTLEVTRLAAELIKADRSVFFFVNEGNKMLESKIKSSDEEIIDLKIPLSKSIIGLCALRNKSFIVEDVSKDKRFNPIYDEVFNYKTKNLLVVPICEEDENVIAVLEIINKKVGNFAESDIEIINLFTRSIVSALSNCKKTNEFIIKTKEESLTNVSKYIYNDIKNPLITIGQYSKILIKDKLPEEIKQILHLIIKQTDFVDSIGDNLSSYDKEDMNLSIKSLPFKETISDILDLLAEYSESRKVVLFKKIETEATVQMDPKQFMVACYQIIKNACDAQPNNGSVYITSVLNKDTVNIDFKDTGDGVPSDSQKKIFDEFTSFKNKGHIGIGLNIADKIIKAHGGKLSVTNSPEGGAVFTISLPVVKE